MQDELPRGARCNYVAGRKVQVLRNNCSEMDTLDRSERTETDHQLRLLDVHGDVAGLNFLPALHRIDSRSRGENWGWAHRSAAGAGDGCVTFLF